MKYEPVVDKHALMETIRSDYDLPVESLAFLPEGEVGCHYIADAGKDGSYFVTLLTGSRLASLQTQRLDFTLKLTRTLYDQGLFRSLVPPCRTVSGSLRSTFQGQPLFLAEYIPAENLSKALPYSPEILTELGRLTAGFHQAGNRLDMEIPYREDFSVPFESDFHQALEELEQVDDFSRQGQQILRNLLLPRQEELLQLMELLKELGAAARDLHPPLVLVHTDPTPANILRKPTGQLLFVDWEGARLAPAEQDLALLTEAGFSILLAEYLRQMGQPRLEPALFAYYFHRRTLEDLTDFLVQILYENRSADQDAHDLKWLQLDCLDGLPGLKDSQAWVAQQLEMAARS
jgi:thiamine kinase-like enzyme